VLAHAGVDAGPLAITVPQRVALLDYLTDQGANATLDLSSEATDDVQTKVRGLIALVLQSAEFQIF